MLNVNITVHLDPAERHALRGAIEFLTHVAALFPPADEAKAKALLAAIEGSRDKVETMRATLEGIKDDPA